jgi:hypothetical protein
VQLRPPRAPSSHGCKLKFVYVLRKVHTFSCEH